MTRKKVLVVDDDKLICWALEKGSSRFHMDVRSVNTGADAMSDLCRQPYDLVFLDINLPDSDGIDLLDGIRRISSSTKTIIMSCNADEDNRERAFAGGAWQFLEKPFDFPDILAILKSNARDYPRPRKQPRHLCRLSVEIALPVSDRESSPCDPGALSGIVTDLHSQGFKLRSESPLKVGQDLLVKIPVGNDPFLRRVPPRAVAEVVWVLPSGCEIVAGLKFRC